MPSLQADGAAAEDSDAESLSLSLEMGSLAVPDAAQHAAESALASLEVRTAPAHPRASIGIHE